MSDAATRAHTIHQKSLERLHGEWVVYADGQLSIRVRAVRAASDSANASGEGENIIHARELDWLIRSSLLVHEGKQIEPRPGATITPEQSEAVYEVNNGPSGECFRWSDTRQVRLRIHTDRIEKVDA